MTNAGGQTEEEEDHAEGLEENSKDVHVVCNRRRDLFHLEFMCRLSGIRVLLYRDLKFSEANQLQSFQAW